jgi:hypothetical protein
VEVREPAFWREVMPILHPDGSALTAPEVAANTDADDLRSEGWFQRDGVLDPADTKRLLAGVVALRERGLHPAWSWAWDEPWALFLRLAPLWRAWLGPEWRILPAFWTWYVPAVPGLRGWAPHQDRGIADVVEPDGMPTFLSAWIPLTPALPSNGCMYLLPMGHDPYRPSADSLASIRAMPVRPGGVIGWNHAVWHWSGIVGPDAPCPRVSIGLELQRGDRPPGRDGLIEPDRIPDLEGRLRLVAEMFQRYSHMTTIDAHNRALAEAVLS